MTTYKRIRRRAYEILEKAQPGDSASLAADVFILILISLNILAMMLETINAVNEVLHETLAIFEFVSVIIFSLEYILRLWVSVEADIKGNNFTKRIIYMFSFLALIDLLAILPFYLAILPIDMRFFRVLRLFRIFRVFKIGRYSNSLGTMIRVFRRKIDDLLISFFVIGLILIVISNIMYYVETNAQPDLFSNVFEAMWWGIVTVTGVGYGDIVPATTIGRILGAFIAVLGIVIIAIPIGILGAAYVEDAENKRQGKIKVIRTTGHIIICGYNQTIRYVAEELLREKFGSKIIIVTQLPNPEIPGVIYVNADWTDINVLKHLSIDQAAACILAAEDHNNTTKTLDEDIVDMRVLFTLYKIKNTYPNVHTISEVINPTHISMIKSNLKGDEIILKEIIDGNLIANCIKIPRVSALIYELVNLEGKIIQETSLHKLGIEEKCLYNDIIKYGIDNDIIFIGYIRGEHNISKLSPSKNEEIFPADRIIYLANR